MVRRHHRSPTVTSTRRMRSTSDAFWRKHAVTFARHYEPAATGAWGRFVHAFLDRRARLLDGWLHVRPGDRALDMGCGHGVYLVALARQGARVTGVDISAGMLALARRYLVEAKHRGWRLLRGSIDSVRLPRQGYHLVLAVGLLDYLPDWRRALDRLAGWTRPGGRVIFTIPKRPSPFFFLRSGPGLVIRRVLFGLPPILVAVTRRELEHAVAGAGLVRASVVSCQGTMWIVRVRKPTS